MFGLGQRRERLPPESMPTNVTSFADKLASRSV